LGLGCSLASGIPGGWLLTPENAFLWVKAFGENLPDFPRFSINTIGSVGYEIEQ